MSTVDQSHDHDENQQFRCCDKNMREINKRKINNDENKIGEKKRKYDSKIQQLSSSLSLLNCDKNLEECSNNVSAIDNNSYQQHSQCYLQYQDQQSILHQILHRIQQQVQQEDQTQTQNQQEIQREVQQEVQPEVQQEFQDLDQLQHQFQHQHQYQHQTQDQIRHYKNYIHYQNHQDCQTHLDYPKHQAHLDHLQKDHDRMIIIYKTQEFQEFQYFRKFMHPLSRKQYDIEYLGINCVLSRHLPDAVIKVCQSYLDSGESQYYSGNWNLLLKNDFDEHTEYTLLELLIWAFTNNRPMIAKSHVLNSETKSDASFEASSEANSEANSETSSNNSNIFMRVIKSGQSKLTSLVRIFTNKHEHQHKYQRYYECKHKCNKKCDSKCVSKHKHDQSYTNLDDQLDDQIVISNRSNIIVWAIQNGYLPILAWAHKHNRYWDVDMIKIIACTYASKYENLHMRNWAHSGINSKTHDSCHGTVNALQSQCKHCNKFNSVWCKYLDILVWAININNERDKKTCALAARFNSANISKQNCEWL